MSSPLHFEPGNYRFLPDGPFSAGVAAEPGFALRRVRFGRPVPMASGFAAIKEHLARQSRPLTALAACELRSPKPMTPEEFAAFNAGYLKTLHEWGGRDGDRRAGRRKPHEFLGRSWRPRRGCRHRRG